MKTSEERKYILGNIEKARVGQYIGPAHAKKLHARMENRRMNAYYAHNNPHVNQPGRSLSAGPRTDNPAHGQDGKTIKQKTTLKVKT